MWFFELECIPSPASEAAQNVKGAFVVCWINVKTEWEAIATSKATLRNAGWAVTGICQSCPVSLATQPDKGLQLYKEAEKNGIAYQIFAWERDDS